MNKYAIYCDSLEDEQMLKDWIKKESDLKGYDNYTYIKNYFHYPALTSYKFDQNFHIFDCVISEYTKINIKYFLKEYYKMNKLPRKWFIEVTEDNFDIVDKWVYDNNGYHPTPPRCISYLGEWCSRESYETDKSYTEITTEQFKKYVLKENMKTELLGLPIIKGEKHHLEAFVKDCKQLGYRMSTYSNVTTSGIIKLNTNTDEEAYRDSGFKILFNLGCCGNYTGDPTLPIKEFQLPSQWQNALDFMKENMDRWNKIQEENKEPEFKVGDIVVCLDTQNTLVGTKDTVYKIVEHKLNNKDFVYIGEYSCISTKRLRFATPEEIEEYNNKLKIFKMTSSSGDFELEVSKKGIYYRPEDSWVDPTSIEKMLLSAIPVYGKFNSRLPLHTYTMEFETVKVGCKSGCSVKAWKEVYEYYKSLQK